MKRKNITESSDDGTIEKKAKSSLDLNQAISSLLERLKEEQNVISGRIILYLHIYTGLAKDDKLKK